MCVSNEIALFFDKTLLFLSRFSPQLILAYMAVINSLTQDSTYAEY